MLSEAIGGALPAAFVVALSPFPVIGVVLILASPLGRRNGPLFALGWVAGLAVVATLIVVLFGGADDPDSTSSAIADWLRVVVGAALIVMGVRKWLKRPRTAEEVVVPTCMASLEDATAVRSLRRGVLLSGANPKNFVLTAAAATAMVEAGAEGTDLVIAVAVFVLIGSCTVLGAVVAHLVGGRRAAAFLDGVRQFMVANSTVIMVIVLLLIGASVLGDGIAALGR